MGHPSPLASYAEPALPTLQERLRRIYGQQAEDALVAIQSATAPVVARLASQPASPQPRWSQRDVVLITYADQVRSAAADGPSPLAALREWLKREQLDEVINTVHLLPFCPYSSDDGFSVIDYLAVDPNSGTWEDIAALGEHFQLMFDLVLNHISEQSEWFQAYLRGESPCDGYFIEVDPADDYSAVVRPRPGMPYKEVNTSRGSRHVWSTFSDGPIKDQIDLNYGDPALLAQMLRILLEYAARGGRIIRLDAIAYLWKELGTPCIHLTQTHEVVKLCRDLLAEHAPQTLVLTETNVPHAENVSYFGQVAADTGQADEAHMVYNFSLPPLLLDAFVNGDATAIRTWLANLAPPPPGCTFFNFTASHDGIGVRPLEGLVPDERLLKLVEHVQARGGKVNMRRMADGRELPYELNITFVDALSPTALAEDHTTDELHARRFLSSQAVMLALRGMPAPYFHSLVGTRNDYAGVEATGQNRRINRHKYDLAELDAHLSDADTLQRRIYEGFRELLALRIQQPAFHPDALQEVIEADNDHVLAFQRTSLDGQQTVLVAVNFSGESQHASSPVLGPTRDLLTGDLLTSTRVGLPAGGFVMASFEP